MRDSIQQLALFGGRPAFSENRRVGRPNTGDRERFLERMNQVLDNEWLSNMGPMMYEFEARVAELAQVRHCVSLCNATVALQLLVGDLATGGAPGDEVIVPSLTFPATAHAVKWRGLTPVFCDVDPVTGLIDPEQVEALITDRTRAIIGVHLWGQVCDVARLEKIAESYGLRLYFDAAPALGCSYGDVPVGGLGHAEVFSFHATKIVNSFEGGAIVTDDDALAERMRAERNFGFGKDGTVQAVGTNGKLSEAAAAMGLTSLEGLDATIARNRTNYEQYRSALTGIPGVTVLEFEGPNRNNHHYMMVNVVAGAAGLHRDVLLDVLRAENILAQPYFSQVMQQMTPYIGAPPVRLPRSEELCGQLLALPTGPQVDADDILLIGEVIRTAVAYGHEVTARRRLRPAVGLAT
ncbi:aminotransferase class I/II-fold pyridoxal phosphate-dependent enzyme [Streptomyces sp. NBC_01387]|uniref:aminotransferase class I/II-fold pyridoxal phosphate-dependent enzyme n=1 Tax=unclassified Streptomyces TaxID=2593676 RepID=UPI002024F8FB|nr:MULTISPECIES: aminotransferase class I/II-fold pyridoxal phosphate-dependent enzyme [unclassified Streptomyces]MCX4547583.1 aminotransferase class I/II-fold pyridoxal phosphate-dependent enzyme [Streptomyces sp. NBC_01500]WSC19270.1 aminotransferase class I/II-fold pyridoxal phosphate-dependent enzyme [Streptomyces sp. NBC_01766]WSV53293.1 aminotransferase class I/II-fold pyridoxal phosphate-dependent enzyme [Streptomyces sp. NBC_01014]